MAEIVPFTGPTTLDLDPDKILEANKGQFEHFVLVGPGKDGKLRFCGTTSDLPQVIVWLERAKGEFLKLIEAEDDA
jgi:hypothetical protein